jgi:SH3-like domain-containing protein
MGLAIPAAIAQTPTPPPATGKPAPAPIQPVHKPATTSSSPASSANPTAATKPTPVVHPHGPTHAQKPSAKAQPAKPIAPPAETAPTATAPATPAAPERDLSKGSVTGLPVPRFVALRSDDVNLRAGPGTRYPIEWVFKRRDLPMEIEREFDVWRLVRDPDGVRGWVQQATLVGRRSFIVTGADRTVRHDPQDTAAAVAILQPGVIGHIRSCEAQSDWCQVQVADYKGWLKRSDFWGTLPNEAVAN